MDTQAGFLRALFDTRFGTLITPKIIRVLYILTIIVLALVAIAFIIGGFQNSVGLGIATLLIFAPLGFLIYLIVARIWLELVIVAFKINESAQQIQPTRPRQPGRHHRRPRRSRRVSTGTPPATTG